MPGLDPALDPGTGAEAHCQSADHCCEAGALPIIGEKNIRFDLRILL